MYQTKEKNIQNLLKQQGQVIEVISPNLIALMRLHAACGFLSNPRSLQRPVYLMHGMCYHSRATKRFSVQALKMHIAIFRLHNK